MTAVITIRPEAGAARTLAAGRALGLDMHHFALAEVVAHPWSGPDPAHVDGLLVGSANVFRHGGEGLARYAAKPVFAVGDATAAAARQSGFAVEMTGEGGLQLLVERMANQAPLRLLRLAGERHVPLEPPAGITITTCTCYGLKHLPVPQEMALLLGGKALVMLHSAAAAMHLAAECDRLGLARGMISLVALGPRIAAAAGTGWADVRCPPLPVDGELLALAQKMCQ